MTKSGYHNKTTPKAAISINISVKILHKMK